MYKKTPPKVFVFGIDGASPHLIFKKWRKDLPTISKLMRNGAYMLNRSTIPPITIAAWSAMFSGKDPSELGIFAYNYKGKNGKSEIISSKNVQAKRIWDILGPQGKKTVSLYVPLTFPAKKINGVMVTDFLTPDINAECTYPANIKEKIKALGNTDNFFDVAVGLAGHKGLEIEDLIKRTYEMTDMQITLAKDMLANEQWDLFIGIMLGTDRLQHMIWHHFDETHRKHPKNSPYKNAIRDYYKYLDGRLAELLKLLPADTTVIVASDHGMIKQNGKININNWLVQEGYMVLKPEFKDISVGQKIRFKQEMVDMKQTIAWGSGVYHGRIYLNHKKLGRNLTKIRKEITKKLMAIPDDKGKKITTVVFEKEKIYKNPSHPDAPDLTVYFDGLAWAANPDLGIPGMYSWESAAGADSAGHSDTGMFIISGPTIKKRGQIKPIDIRQIAPTILKLLGAKIPKDISVKPINL